MSRKNSFSSCFGFFKEGYGETEKRKQKKVKKENRMMKK